MPCSTEVAEKLARHYFLSPALVQQAAQLFDEYTHDDTAPADVEPRISVTRLQQLLVALGAPLSQQDVVEILQLFSTSAATAIPTSSQLAAAAPAKAAVSAASSSAPASAAAAAAGATTAAAAAPVPTTSGGAQRVAQTAASRKGNAAAHRGGNAASTAPNRPSSRRTTSAPPTGEGAGHTPQQQQQQQPEELLSTASTLLTFTTRPISSADHGGATAGDERQNNGSLSTSAPAALVSAVNLHGMTFPAFLCFLLVYPTLVQHIFRHSASTAAGTTTTAFTAADVAELFAQLDSDGDGVCSAQDVRRVAERCATDYDGLLLDDADLCRLAEMHPVELEEAIREFDVDGDGVVTLNDLQQALQY